MASRTVFRTPSTGARGFLEWAVDLWPYVNGRALNNGVNLKELDAKDMIDVLHFYFEEDLMADSKEEIESKNRIRSLIYREMYFKAYKYGNTSPGESYNYSTASDGFIGDEDDKIEDPLKPPTKPFTPTTDFNPESSNPFGRIVDPPLG